MTSHRALAVINARFYFSLLITGALLLTRLGSAAFGDTPPMYSDQSIAQPQRATAASACEFEARRLSIELRS